MSRKLFLLQICLIMLDQISYDSFYLSTEKTEIRRDTGKLAMMSFPDIIKEISAMKYFSLIAMAPHNFSK